MNRCRIVTILVALLALLALATTAGADAETYRTMSADGAEIAYETWGDTGAPLVFIHGWSCDRSYWREQVEVFAKKHKVVSIDLAGHGASGADRADYTMAAFGADVVAVLVDAGIDGALLIGHSMGGPVAVETALLAPDRVRGIIGVDNFQSFSEEIPRAQVDAFLGALRGNFAVVVDAWVKSMFPADADSTLKATVAADMAAGDPEVGISAMSHTLPWMGGEGATRVVQLEVNITVVNSEMHPTQVEENRKLVPGFKARFMGGVGHFLMLERPQEFNGLLVEAVAEFASE